MQYAVNYDAVWEAAKSRPTLAYTCYQSRSRKSTYHTFRLELYDDYYGGVNVRFKGRAKKYGVGQGYDLIAITRISEDEAGTKFTAREINLVADGFVEGYKAGLSSSI